MYCRTLNANVQPILIGLLVAAIEWKLVVLMLVLKSGAEAMKVHFGRYSD